VGFADLLLYAVPFLALFPLRNNDLWWHLASGREMIERGGFLRDDPFSFTGFMGAWVDNEWLSQLVFYGTWLIGGNLGLVVLRACLYSAVFLLIRSLLRSGRRPSAFLASLVVGIALSYGWWEVRPSVFSVLGTLLLLVILERIRRSGRGFVTLPILFLVWASMHPGFLFGLCVLVGTVAGLYAERLLPGWPTWTSRPRTSRRLAAWTALSILATLVNPYGWNVYRQQAAIAGNTAYRAILDEWAPPSTAFLLLVLMTVGVFLIARYRRLALACWIPILGGAALATTGVRFEEYFALVAVPAMLMGSGSTRASGFARVLVPGLMIGSILVGLQAPLSASTPEGQPVSSASGTPVDPADARLASRLKCNALLLSAVAAGAFATELWRRRRPGRRLRPSRLGHSNWAFVSTAVVAAALLASNAPRLGWLPKDYVEPGRYPDACLAALPHGDARTFNKLSWGGWLIWTAHVRTFIDGRCWGQPIFFEYSQGQGPDWRRVFDRHRIDWAIGAGHASATLNLSRSPDWELVCDDAVSVVYRRRRE
jgi:hypothetical protein